jgi:capsule biosynthesis phosphatase
LDRESELIAKAMARAPRTIAVDLDGTLASQDGGWRGFQYIGPPIMSVVRELRKEKKAGARIVLHTCRVTTLDNKVNPESLDTIRDWLKKHRVPVDEIWMGTGKPWADAYWDDKAVRKP